VQVVRQGIAVINESEMATVLRPRTELGDVDHAARHRTEERQRSLAKMGCSIIVMDLRQECEGAQGHVRAVESRA
jgi:hypothetical protein